MPLDYQLGPIHSESQELEAVIAPRVTVRASPIETLADSIGIGPAVDADGLPHSIFHQLDALPSGDQHGISSVTLG
jgi:hypothetical protein